MVWKGADSGCFTIKAYFRLLEGASPHSVPTKMLWNSYVPSKLFFLPGRLGGARCLLLLNLRKEAITWQTDVSFVEGRKKRWSTF